MSHDLEIRNGRASLFLADKGAWHNLGTVVQGARDRTEAQSISRLDWEVKKIQLFARYGNPDSPKFKPIPAWGIFRMDNGDFLSSVGASYKPVQNDALFDMVDALIGVEGGAHYESAGVLGRGEKVWVAARMPYDFNVDGQDAHRTYLLGTTSHDGSSSTIWKEVVERVVCANTLGAALSENGTSLKVRHTASADVKIEQAKKFLGQAAKTAQEVCERLTHLSHKMLDKETYIRVMDRLFPKPKTKGENGESVQESTARRDNVLLEIAKLFEHNDGDAFPDFRGTAFNLLNAVTEYTDHVRGVRITEARGHNDEQRARRENAIWGTGDALKSQAMEIIMEESAGCKERPYKTYLTRALENGERDRGQDPPARSILDDIIET